MEKMHKNRDAASSINKPAKYSLLIVLVILFVILIWGVSDFLWFHDFKLKTKLVDINIPVPRASAFGFEIQPMVVTYNWGLLDAPERKNSGNPGQFLDFDRIGQLLRGKYSGFYQCVLTINNGVIQNGWQNNATATTSMAVNHYIQDVISSFSKHFSVWANVQLGYIISFDSPPTIKIHVSSIKRNPYFMPGGVAGIGNCPLGSFGNVKYGNICSADRLVASRGFSLQLQ